MANSLILKKVALLVGCNYAKTQYALHGCINDVVAMRETLVQRLGFEQSNIKLLTDADDDNTVLPTGANIKAALNQMIDEAQPGDVLYFHYSGHGTTIEKPVGDAIVPCDFNLITDVDFRVLVDRVPKGASLTILSDSCFSGGLIDKEKEQIGPSHYTKGVDSRIINSSKHRLLPFNSILQHLQSVTKIDTLDIATQVLQSFGDDASLRFRLPPLDLEHFKNLKPDDGILLSGCQANEYSADMPPSEKTGGKSYGAFSSAVEEVLKGWPASGLSNRQVVTRAREILKTELSNSQHPCLYCSDEHADVIFLGQSAKKAKASL
ncbi:hypothetical protein ACFE04_015026 [Oxalis oulophora]